MWSSGWLGGFLAQSMVAVEQSAKFGSVRRRSFFRRSELLIMTTANREAGLEISNNKFHNLLVHLGWLGCYGERGECGVIMAAASSRR